MSLSATLFGRDSFIFKATNAMGLGIPGWLDRKFGAPPMEGPRLSDLSVQTSTLGAPLARVYGTVAVSGNVIWLEGNQLKETVRKKKQGGKGGGGSEATKTYSYSATFAVSLCEGPIAGVRRVWVGPDLIYNAGTDDLETIIASNQATADGGGTSGVKFRVYTGTADQLPDSRIEADMGVGLTPAFRGTAYIVFYDLPLAKYGNSLMGAQVKVEVYPASPTSVCTPVTEWDKSLPGHSQRGNRAALVLSGGLIHNYGGDGYVYKYRLDGREVGRVAVPTPASRVDRGRGVNNPYLQVIERESDSTVYLIDHAGGGVPGSPLADGLGRQIFGGHYAVSHQPLEVKGGRVAIYGPTSGGNVIVIYDGQLLEAWREIPESPGHTGAWCFDGTYIYMHTLSSELFQYDAETLELINRWDTPQPAHATQFGPGLAVVGGEYLYVNEEWAQNIYTKIYRLGANGEISELCNLASNASYGFALVDPTTVVMLNSPTAKFFSPYRSAEEGVSLADVVDRELLLSNLVEQADVNVSSLASDRVRGYRIAGVQQIRASISPLQGAYPFDVIPSGYQIKAVRRGLSAAVATVPLEHLDARTYGDAIGLRLDQSREMDTQLPRKVVLRHLDASREYDMGEQYSPERLSSQAVNLREVEMPLVLTPDEAARVSEVLFNVPWVERDTFAFRLPAIYSGLEPADVITVDAGYALFPLRLSDVQYRADGILECAARPAGAASYTSSAVGGEGVVPDGTIPLTGDAETVLLDIPLIVNSQNEPGFAAAMAGSTEHWPGGILLRSADNEQTWTDVQAWTSPVTLGTARDALPADDGRVINRTQLLRVDILAGELEGITEAQMMTGINWAAYGADGRWELLRFAGAELQSDGSYILTTLLRGLRGSEWATGLHQSGDSFVLLDDPDVAFIGADLAALNVNRKWRGVSAGQSVDDVASEDFAYRGVNLKPLSPVHGTALQSGADWVLAWDPRTRLQGSLWKTGVALPNGEATESYQIDILDGAAVKRTLTSSTPAVTYTESQQIEDFGSAQSTISARVYQMSADVGRGYPHEITA